MVHQCVVCNVSSKTNKAISFHSFPKEETRRKKWMKSLNIKYINDSTCICSQHFNKCDYKIPLITTSKPSRPLLKSSAVPFLCAKKSDDVENVSSISEESTANETFKLHLNETDKDNMPLQNIRRLGDINIDKVSQTPDEAKMCLEVAMDVIKEQRQKIKYYQTKNKRLEKSVHNLKLHLADLKNKFSLYEASTDQSCAKSAAIGKS